MPVTKNPLKTVAKVTTKILVIEAVIFCIYQLFNSTTKDPKLSPRNTNTHTSHVYDQTA